VSEASVKGQTILVTGATGLFGLPLAKALAAENEVYGVARFTDPAAKAELERAGVRTVPHELGADPIDALPAEVDYVFHAAVLGTMASELDHRRTFAVNAQATGRLMARYRRAKGFVHCSTGSAYAYQGQRPLREDDPYGVHIGNYSLSKVAAEAVVEFACREWQVPTVTLRIFTLYSTRGGSLTNRVDLVAAGKEIPLYPDKPNRTNPIYETDYVELAIKAMTRGSVPPLVTNFAGSETMSIEDYLAYAGELLGLAPKLRYIEEVTLHGQPVYGRPARVDPTRSYEQSAVWSLWPDVTRMHRLLGHTKVGVREGVRRVVEARYGGARSRG
jgi:nucleoside-diphosphate-sugar epimerase